MNQTKKLLAIFLIIVSMKQGLFDIDQENDDIDYIEAKSHQYYLRTHNNKITKKCAINEMVSYGLEGDAEDLSSPNEICPNLPNGNCCGKNDIEHIKAYWKADTYHQGYYHAAYLKMHRYILGFAKQYSYIAFQIMEKAKIWTLEGKLKNKKLYGSIEDEDNHGEYNYRITYHPMCVESAEKFIHMDFVDKKKAQVFYAEQNRRIQYLQNARRGFYCMLCDAKAKKYILTRRYNPLPKSIKYSRDFCQLSYNWMFTSVYMVDRAYNPFLKHLFRLLSCVKPLEKDSSQNNVPGVVEDNESFNPLSLQLNLKTHEPYSKLPKELKKMFKNPLNLKRKGWLDNCYNSDPQGFWFPINCYYFCDNFNMIKAQSTMDGDIDANKVVYDLLQQYEFALKSPTENIFNDDVFQLKQHIELAYYKLGGNYYFYRALNPEIDFADYKTDFSIWYKGVNPFAISEGSSLEFIYSGISILLLNFCFLFLSIFNF